MSSKVCEDVRGEDECIDPPDAVTYGFLNRFTITHLNDSWQNYDEMTLSFKWGKIFLSSLSLFKGHGMAQRRCRRLT